MRRRTVSTITAYPEPKQIYKMITCKHWDYAHFEETYQKYVSRDRCLMACGLVSAGRITAIIGGPKYRIDNKCSCGGLLERLRSDKENEFHWICYRCKKDYGRLKPKDVGELVVDGEHSGLQKKNFEISEDFITINNMEVIKRKRETIEKYGMGVTLREPFRLPLRRGLYKEEYVHRDQVIPFAWLIKEYLEKYMAHEKEEERLFNFGRRRAWEIINSVTGKFPNWFRSQSEHFHGHYIIKDSVKLSKFVKVVNPMQVAHYIGYTDSDQLKDSNMSMNFDWIDKEVQTIKERIKNGKS